MSRNANDPRGREYYDRGREDYRPDAYSRPYPGSYQSPRSPHPEDYDRRGPQSPPRYSVRRSDSRGRRSTSRERLPRPPDRNYDRGRSRSHSRPPRDNGSRTPNQSYGPNPISPGRRIADSYVPHPPYPNSRADDRDVNRSGTKSSVPALLKRIDTDSNDGARGNVGTAGPGIGGMNRQS